MPGAVELCPVRPRKAATKLGTRAVMSVVKALVRKIPPGPIIPVAGSDAGMRGGGRALSDG